MHPRRRLLGRKLRSQPAGGIVLRGPVIRATSPGKHCRTASADDASRAVVFASRNPSKYYLFVLMGSGNPAQGSPRLVRKWVSIEAKGFGGCSGERENG